MVTQAQASKAVDGGVQTPVHRWTRIATPGSVVLVLGLGVLIALASFLAAYQARSSGPAAGPAAGDTSGITQQQFLDRNTHLPIGVGVAAGQSGSHQRQLATIDQRDSGVTAVPGGSTGRPGSLGWVEARDYAVLPVSLPQATRQQAQLYAIEVRDNGAGTTDGDGGPCRTPGRSCDR